MYGDLTPFPHDVDYVALLRDGITCAVQLATAQCSIDTVHRQRQESGDSVQGQQLELAHLLEHLQQAAEGVKKVASSQEPSRAEVASERIVAAGRRLIDSAACQLCSDYSQIVKDTEAVRLSAKDQICRAVEEFFNLHTPPNSILYLNWRATSEGYQAQLHLETSMGLSAFFQLAPPFSGNRQLHRRVDDFASDVVLHIPRPPLYQGAKPVQERLRLDQFCVVEMQTAPQEGMLLLRKWVDRGPELRLRWLESGLVSATHKQGEEKSNWTLCGEDTASLSGFWQRLLVKSLPMASDREKLVTAQFEGVEVAALEHPVRLAERIVDHLAPLTVEMGRRAMVPGQYALRGLGQSDVSCGTSLSRSQILETISELPKLLKAIFLPLKLDQEATSDAVKTAELQPADLLEGWHSEPPPRRSPSETGVSRRMRLPPPRSGERVHLDFLEEIECEAIGAA